MIPPGLAASLATFNASVAAAAPIAQANSLTKAALVKAGQQLISQIDQAAELAGAGLDANDPQGFAGDMVTSLLGLSATNDDQAVLIEIRGYVGRAIFNLGQA